MKESVKDNENMVTYFWFVFEFFVSLMKINKYEKKMWTFSEKIAAKKWKILKKVKM